VSHIALQDVRALFSTWLASIPALANVGSLIALVFFMYAYIGVYLFGQLRWNIGEHCRSSGWFEMARVCKFKS
jgi:hypothetical protein